jgi:hypothetical protein
MIERHITSSPLSQLRPANGGALSGNGRSLGNHDHD